MQNTHWIRSANWTQLSVWLKKLKAKAVSLDNKYILWYTKSWLIRLEILKYFDTCIPYEMAQASSWQIGWSSKYTITWKKNKSHLGKGTINYGCIRPRVLTRYISLAFFSFLPLILLKLRDINEIFIQHTW